MLFNCVEITLLLIELFCYILRKKPHLYKLQEFDIYFLKYQIYSVSHILKCNILFARQLVIQL